MEIGAWQLQPGAARAIVASLFDGVMALLAEAWAIPLTADLDTILVPAGTSMVRGRWS